MFSISHGFELARNEATKMFRGTSLAFENCELPNQKSAEIQLTVVLKSEHSSDMFYIRVAVPSLERNRFR